MRTIAIVLGVALGAGTGVSGAEVKAEEAEQGRRAFRIYCASCHGEQARGDGPTAELLKVAPADLTRLRKGSAGEFPEERIRRAIDGRDPVRGHGTREMPIWGLAFQEPDSDSNQEHAVRAEIRCLIEYLKTIQE